ncbi:hypothetical protein ABLG96_12445 [Nakamurella sp. A5-74]|uniref:Uncharacterized protein n=1 Tax=Nakamurella sp. A5-74 TaxID=3158264 RepID=A0AAU8DL57_9ACTN
MTSTVMTNTAVTGTIDTVDARRPTPFEQIVGIDGGLPGEAAAEHFLARAIHALRQEGVHVGTAATHRAQVDEIPHVSLSLSMSPTADAAGVVELLSSLLNTAGTTTGAIWTGGSGIGLPALQGSAEQAAAAHHDRSSGRVVRFPGSDKLTGTVTVADVLSTAIDRIEVLGGGDPAPGSLLVTRDFLRPRWNSGRLVLHVQPAVGDTWVPFETPKPTPCCANHN